MPSAEQVPKQNIRWFTAVASGDYEYLRHNIRELGGIRNDSGGTALMKAADKNDTKAIELLLPSEATLQDHQGMTALMFAARSGALEALTLLVGKEGGMMDASGYTALMHAVTHGRVSTARALIPYEAGLVRPHGWTALMDAASRNASDIVSLLLEHEGGRSNEFGVTALMLAAMSGADRCIELLMPREVRMQDNLGCSALVYAIKVEHVPSILRLLPEEHAVCDSEGKYPTDYANCDSDIVFLIREYDWRRIKPSRAVFLRFVSAIYTLLSQQEKADLTEVEVVHSLLSFLVDDASLGWTTSDIANRIDEVVAHLHLSAGVLCSICKHERFEYVALPCRHAIVCGACRAAGFACPTCSAQPISYLTLAWPGE